MRKPILALALLLTTAACGGHNDPAPVPTAPAPVPTSAGPAQFSAVAGGCPALSGAVPVKYGAAGKGKPAASAGAVPGITTVNCRWKPAEARPSVSVQLAIFPNGFAPAGNGVGNAQHFYDGLHADVEDADPEKVLLRDDRDSADGYAFAAAYPPTDTVTYSQVVGNAVVTVTVRVREKVTTDLATRGTDLLLKVGSDAKTLAGQAAAALR
jgi:hypothetical protein